MKLPAAATSHKESRMQRVLIIGSGGAGKSTLARDIGARLALPVVHLDALYWQSGWRETAKAEWVARVSAAVAEPAWVMDGNYSGTLDVRLPRADTVIFLDLPRVQCLWRVISRWWRYRGRTRPDMAPGCNEQLSWEFVSWIWTYPGRRRREALERLATLRPNQQVVILSSSRAVRSFLNALRVRHEHAST